MPTYKIKWKNSGNGKHHVMNMHGKNKREAIKKLRELNIPAKRVPMYDYSEIVSVNELQ